MLTNPSEWFPAILDTMDEGIHVVDAHGVTVVYNRAASMLDGVDPRDVIGRHVLEAFPSLGEETSTLLQVLFTGQAIHHRAQTFTNIKGMQVHTVNTTLPIRRQSKVVGALEISKDFTHVKELADQLSELQTRMVGARKNKAQPVAACTFEQIVSGSDGMQSAIARARRAARTDSPILVYGETGTGKELLVQSIHNASPRKAGPFMAINCAALPASILEGLLFGTIKGSFTGAETRAGWFELADTGTLFLDEVQSLPLEVQAKLLRVLQSGEFTRLGEAKLRQTGARVVAAMNVPPEAALASGTLRADVYYRLNVVRIDIPPLRERGADIDLLVHHFIDKWNQRLGTHVESVHPQVLSLFRRYPWPGNVRELENCIEAALNLLESGTLQISDLPRSLQEAATRQETQQRSAENSAMRSAEKSANAQLWAHEVDEVETVWSALLQKTGLQELWTHLDPRLESGEHEETALSGGLPEDGREGDASGKLGAPLCPTLPDVLEKVEQAILQKALEKTGHNVQLAARRLGLPRQTLQYRLARKETRTGGGQRSSGRKL
ncbi:MAG: sigma 54-interacting transcriptional regulator [Alicyclobacillaceae bacterium]|nr:sigma 54-interacting transcriptional regulator [Alicyclobacillaceae bacterium]